MLGKARVLANGALAACCAVPILRQRQQGILKNRVRALLAVLLCSPPSPPLSFALASAFAAGGVPAPAVCERGAGVAEWVSGGDVWGARVHQQAGLCSPWARLEQGLTCL